MKRKRYRLVEAYSDKSGNGGNNLFDSAQPWFWTGTLVSPVDVQTRGLGVIQRMIKQLGVTDLHAKELGLGRIESVGRDLLRLLEDVEARFVFTALEKSHLASTKLVDTVLDSGTNAAVSVLTYGFRALRIPLAHAIVENMTLNDQKDFWEIYRTRDTEKFRSILARIVERIRPRVKDARTRELLEDAFAWAISYPKEVLDFKRSDEDAPNMVSFSLILSGLHEMLDGTDLRVGKFVHDSQQQFGAFMELWYQIGRKLQAPTDAFGFMADLERIDTYRGQFQVVRSAGVVGLKLIDIVLWLYRRSLGDSMRAYPNCADLVTFAAERGILKRFSRDQLRESAKEAIDVLSRTPDPDPRREAEVRAFLAQMEAARLARMGGLR